MNYVPLYVKTENSLLTSTIRIHDLIDSAKKNGYQALSITDNNLFGAMEFYNQCLENHIKPIIGLEITLDFKIILYAKDYTGYKNLIKLSTMISSAHITLHDLENYSSHLLAILPFSYRNLYSDMNKIYETVWIGYENLEEYQELDSNIAIYMRETLYLKKEDQKYIKYLWAIRDSKKLEEINFLKKDSHFISKEEIKQFEYNDNNQKLIDLCNLKIKLHQDLLPIYECPNHMDSFSYLKELCREGMRRIFGSRVNRIYIERLKYELKIIHQMGFCNYFLVVYDYVQYAKDHQILVGPGRGSVAGSLVSYLLNITTIDPIQYNLLFERFLNPERVTMPDIDIDFQDNRREEVIHYCTKKYGIKKVAGIITFGTLGAKQAIRDVARVMDIPLTKVDELCKMLSSNLSLKGNYNQERKLKMILENDPQLFDLYKIATRLEGLKRHTSNHAAGIVMCNQNLDEIIPLYKKDGIFLTAYSMDFLEEQGLLKMDFLALKNLSLIDEVIRDIRKTGVNLDFDNIPLNDKETIHIFTNVDTLGIFQFESSGMMNFLRKFRPSSFEDIVAALALFRPGPMNNIDSYIKRKKGLETIDYFDPSLESILKPTYGIMIYQEQIMQVASVMAGYSFGEADILRRAMSKKKEDVLLKERKRFISGSIQKGYSKELAEKVYEVILKFASYGFNRAHSVAYAMIAYRMAYLKAHYRVFFMKSLLTSELNSVSQTKDYIYECKRYGISLLKPDINKSEKDYTLEDGNIRYPLIGLKNLGSAIVDNILEERKKAPFKDIYDFIKRTNRKSIHKRTLISMIDAGCFDSFGFNHKTMIEGIDLIINYGELIKDLEEEFVLLPELEIKKEYSKKELLKRELDVIGFYISDNPITEWKEKYRNHINIANISSYFDKNIEMIGVIDSIKEIQTKKGDQMCFIKISDELSTIDGVIFPKIYHSIGTLKTGEIVNIQGKVEKRFDKYQLIVNQIKYLETA